MQILLHNIIFISSILYYRKAERTSAILIVSLQAKPPRWHQQTSYLLWILTKQSLLGFLLSILNSLWAYRWRWCESEQGQITYIVIEMISKVWHCIRKYTNCYMLSQLCLLSPEVCFWNYRMRVPVMCYLPIQIPFLGQTKSIKFLLREGTFLYYTILGFYLRSG